MLNNNHNHRNVRCRKNRMNTKGQALYQIFENLNKIKIIRIILFNWYPQDN